LNWLTGSGEEDLKKKKKSVYFYSLAIISPLQGRCPSFEQFKIPSP
jgi:hypothetical protein